MLFTLKRDLLLCSVFLAMLHMDGGAAQDRPLADHHSRRDTAALRPNPADLEQKYTRAVTLFNSGRMEQARAIFQELLKVPGGYKDCASYLARIGKQTAAGDLMSNPGADLLPRLEEKGGQAAPSPAAGGLSGAERISRVMMEARKAFQEGQLDQARIRFQEVLQIDSSNSEARRYLNDIERKSGDKLSPSASAELRESGSAGGLDIPLPKPEMAKEAGQSASIISEKTGEAPVGKSSQPTQQQVDKSAETQVAVNARVSFMGSQSVRSGGSSGQAQQFGTARAAKPQEKEATAAQVAQVSAEPKTMADSGEAPVSKEKPKVISAKIESPKPIEFKFTAEAPAAVAAVVPEAKPQNVAAQKEKSAQPVSNATQQSAKELEKPVQVVAEKSKEMQLASQPSLALNKVEPTPPDRTVTRSKPDSAIASLPGKQTPDSKPTKTEAVPVEAKPATTSAAPKTDSKELDPKILKAALESFEKVTDEASKTAGKNLVAMAKVSDKAAQPLSVLSEVAKKAAAMPPPEPQKAPEVDNSKKLRAEATAKTDDGIKLFNEGKYSEALELFSAAISADPQYTQAEQYRSKTEKRLQDKLRKEERVVAQALPALPEITPAAAAAPAATAATPAVASQLPDLPLSDIKPSEKVDDKPSTEKKSDSINLDGQKAAKPTTTELKPLGSTLNENVETERKTSRPEAKTEAASADPKVEADNLFRQAQRELSEGKRDQARLTAERAASLDPNNAEAKAMIEELSGRVASTRTSVPPLGSSPESGTSSGLPEKGAPGVDGLLSEARRKFEAGRTEEALRVYRQVLDMDPENVVAKRYVTDIENGRHIQATAKGATSAARDAQQAGAAFEKGLTAYEAGRLDVAVQWWNYALTLDPTQPRAIEYLQRTGPEYEAWVQQHQYNAIELQKEVGANEKLDTLITYDTAGQKSIVEFLNAMALISDISFYVAEGVDPEISITAKFEDTPLHDSLDIVLLPIGLKWSRTADVVTITTDLRTKFFNLTPEQVGRLKGVMESRTLQRYLYGPEALPPMRNVELTLDDRENLLIVQDTQENISKIEAYLKDMQLASPPGLIYKSWKIRPEEGQKIKALVEAIIKVQSDAPYDLDRKVVVDSDDLIVKDTADNVAKIEQLLLDKNFLRKLETQKLNVVSYNLTPKEPIQDNLEQVRDLANNVVTVVKTILYAQSTESAAAAEGRRYWYDPNTLQLTIVDYPENLRVVGDYIRSLPMLGQKQKSEIIFLKHQTAGELSELLQRVLGLSGDAAADDQTGATGTAVTKTLRVEGEMSLNDLRLRVRRINENNASDDNDDSVEFIVTTRTTSENRTIEEFRVEFIEDYQVNVIEVRPSGTPGEGSARIELRYDPTRGGAGGGGAVQPISPVGPDGVAIDPVTGLPIQTVVQPTTEEALTIDTVENMNALLIRYQDPGDLAEVKSWIEQLDIPVLQVNIETKLVEVNETRAKEFMPEFNILNLNKSDVDWGGGQLDASFAQDVDEFRSPFEPFPENIGNANLLKGTTVMSFLATAGNTPINFTLRMLESEGVVNVVNGPHVVVENGETADFEINRIYGSLPAVAVGGTNIGVGTQTFNQTLQQVALSVTPNITQLGEIRLEIENLELSDFGEEQGAVATLSIDEDELTDTAISNDLGALYNRRQRSLQTVARVHNGGTIVLGGWNGEHSRNNDSGVPILRNIPYIGKLLFNRTSDRIEKTTLLIFLTCHLIDP